MSASLDARLAALYIVNPQSEDDRAWNLLVDGVRAAQVQTILGGRFTRDPARGTQVQVTPGVGGIPPLPFAVSLVPRVADPTKLDLVVNPASFVLAGNVMYPTIGGVAINAATQPRLPLLSTTASLWLRAFGTFGLSGAGSAGPPTVLELILAATGSLPPTLTTDPLTQYEAFGLVATVPAETGGTVTQITSTHLALVLYAGIPYFCSQ